MLGFKGRYENCIPIIKFIGRLYYLNSCITQVILPTLVSAFLLEREYVPHTDHFVPPRFDNPLAFLGHSI